MSIFDGVTTGTNMPLFQKQWDTTNQMASVLGEMFRNLLRYYTDAFGLINNNPLGLTKTEVVEGIGMTDFAKLYRLAVYVKSIINSTSPGAIVDTIGDNSVNVSTAQDPSPAGSIAISISVTDPTLAAIPTGFVEILDNGTVIGKATLDNAGSTTFTSSFTAGVHNIIAIYMGDQNFCFDTKGNLVMNVS